MKEVVINDKKYSYHYNECGSLSLKRYNDKYKMWVKLNFTDHETDVINQVIGSLSELYIQQELASI